MQEKTILKHQITIKHPKIATDTHKVATINNPLSTKSINNSSHLQNSLSDFVTTEHGIFRL